MLKRLLKKFISEPLLNINKIKLRQQAVEELIKNPDIINSCEKIMQNFCEIM